MGRDRHLPLGSAVGPASTRTFRTPANAAIAVGVLAAIPILVDRPARRLHVVDRRDRADLPQLLPVQHRRARRPVPRLAAQAGVVQPRPLGQARQHPRPGLRRLMLINIALWQRPGPVRRLRRRPDGRFTNPIIDTFIKPFGNEDRRAAGVADLRDARRRCSLVVGAIYYAVSVRGRAADVEAATPRPARPSSAERCRVERIRHRAARRADRRAASSRRAGGR